MCMNRKTFVHVYGAFYRWKAGDWSQCSATCGPDATQTRKLKCFVIDLYGTGKHISEHHRQQQNVRTFYMYMSREIFQ